MRYTDEQYKAMTREERTEFIKELIAHNNVIGRGGEDLGSKHVEIVNRQSGYAHNLYTVHLDKFGQLLSDQMLIDFVDGGAYNFGGSVTRHEATSASFDTLAATVKVYID